MRPTRALRALHGVLAASVATLVALLSHVAGGGAMPGWLGIVVPWLLAVAVSTLVIGRRLAIVRLSVAVIVSQLLFHGLFVLGTVSGTRGATSASGVAHHHGPVSLAPSGDTAALVVADAGMWVWHGLAAAVTVLAFRRGEVAVARLSALAGQLVAWAQRRIVRALPPVMSPRPAPAAPSATLPWAPAARPALRAVRLRGPPLLPVL